MLDSASVSDFTVRGQVPRKQGLKLGRIKQRIEEGLSPRASSKKTRIETMPIVMRSRPGPKVRGQVPRKQGLKLQSSKKLRKMMTRSEGKFQENKD